MKKGRHLLWGMTTVILMGFIFISMAGTVVSKSEFLRSETEAYYLEMEQQLARDTRALLNRRGFANSGVTVTRVADADGGYEYTVTVHHKYFQGMAREERQELVKEMGQLVFEGEGVSFTHEFLKNN